MNPINRRENILAILKTTDQPIAGSELATRLYVSRQIIVQDISILRASGEQILATPQGYLLMQALTSTPYRKTFATCHTSEEMPQELEIMVDAGGKVLDVIVEHPVYGELRGILMLSSRRGISIFINNIKNSNSKPLSALTHGIHLHTVEASSEEVFIHIERELDKAGLLLKQ
ncbi:MAG: transcriptional regulator [Desulfitibacter sp. BRH_c19]|nr:MAG: transcriptional regulator [Desulfitibacter sp. BRH_c19]